MMQAILHSQPYLPPLADFFVLTTYSRHNARPLTSVARSSTSTASSSGGAKRPCIGSGSGLRQNRARPLQATVPTQTSFCPQPLLGF